MIEAILRHVALPAVAPAAVIGLYFTPVLLFGCVNRGLLALAVVLFWAGAAFATARIGETSFKTDSMRASVSGGTR